jgi:hypothetical protein
MFSRLAGFTERLRVHEITIESGMDVKVILLARMDALGQ